MEKPNKKLTALKSIIYMSLIYGVIPFIFAYGFVEITGSLNKPLEIAYLIVFFWLIIGGVIERISHND